jgi:hypothetical protein
MKAHLLVVLGLALGLALAVLSVATRHTSQAQSACQRYVSYEGNDTLNDCTVEGKPCRTVQHAINESTDDDRICVSSIAVKPGPTVYSETITLNRSVYLDGKWESQCFTHDPCAFWPVDPCEADRVVLHAEGAGRVINITRFTEPTVDCFTITGGDADELFGDPDGPNAGGGIFSDNASPIIVNNIITGNFGCDSCSTTYGRGGGIYLLNAPSKALVSNNLIANNVADNSTWGQGGGIMLRDSDAKVTENEIRDNRAGFSAGYGGGITVVGGEPAITLNDIHSNVAGQSVQGLGGGIFVWSKTTATIEGNNIYYNQAISGAGDPGLISRGGGIFYSGDPKVQAAIYDNTVRSNIASPISHLGYGGGLYASGLVTPSLIAGNLFEENIAGFDDNGNGGGIYIDTSEATVQGNELNSNSASWAGSWGQGGGLFVEASTVTIRGNTFARNNGGGFPGPPASTIGYGGGMVISGTLALVQDNQIVGNRSTNSPQFGVGGGLYAYTSTVRIVGNTISENSLTTGAAGFGGGLYLHESLATVEGNTIVDNEADASTDGRGGGLRLAFCPAFTLTNNIIARNQATNYASGVGVAESVGRIAHNTIGDNTGGDGSGVHVSLSSDAALYGNIIRGQAIGIVNGDWPASSASAEYTLFEANTNDYTTGVTSLFEIAPPALLLPDYHIPLGSGAINRVPPVPWVTDDIDGDDRPTSVWSDAGADERDDVPLLRSCLPLILRGAP